MGKIPLMLFPVSLYNLIVLGGASLAMMTRGTEPDLIHPWLIFTMTARNTHWNISIGDVVVFIGLVCLFIEMLNATGTSNTSLANHVFSTFVLIWAIVEFLLWGPFATSTFFLLVAMSMLDVLAGFIVTTVAARKDIGFGQ